MSQIAIQVDNLSKCYRLGTTGAGSLRDALSQVWQKKTENALDEKYIWALKNVSFDVNKGESIGILGRNGAGKSTLLKLLARITEPTHGQAQIFGKVASFLEVGTGFHPELTGRENVYLNGAILGMKRREISKKFDEIVEFSEIGKFIDTPIKRYSSGMIVRLAFSVAAHLETDVLLIDEVLAVGDSTYQKKCVDKMQNIMKQGKTILFVSHQLAMMSALCNRALLFSKGTLCESGPTEKIINMYLGSANLSGAEKTWDTKNAREIQ